MLPLHGYPPDRVGAQYSRGWKTVQVLYCEGVKALLRYAPVQQLYGRAL